METILLLLVAKRRRGWGVSSRQNMLEGDFWKCSSLGIRCRLRG